MNLAIPRTEQLYRVIVAQGPKTLSTQDIHGLARGLGLSATNAGKLLTLLEQQDRLVRVARARYMTLETYHGQSQDH